MTSPRVAAAIAGLLTLLPEVHAVAQDSSLDDVYRYVAVEAAGLHLNYAELFDNSTVEQDRQVGWAPGGVVQLSEIIHTPAEADIYVYGEYDYFGGGVNQSAYTAAGARFISYTSRLNMNDADVEVGLALRPGRDWLVIPFLGGEYRDWIRVIDNAAVFRHENYQFWAPGLGFALTRRLTPKLSASAKVSYEYMSSNTLHGADPVSPFQDSHFELGTRGVARLEGRLDWRVMNHVLLEAMARFESFEDGRSANIYFDPAEPTRYVYEPFSKSNELILGGGLKWSFR